jgi:hypothetical protein
MKTGRPVSLNVIPASLLMAHLTSSARVAMHLVQLAPMITSPVTLQSASRAPLSTNSTIQRPLNASKTVRPDNMKSTENAKNVTTIVALVQDLQTTALPASKTQFSHSCSKPSAYRLVQIDMAHPMESAMHVRSPVIRVQPLRTLASAALEQMGWHTYTDLLVSVSARSDSIRTRSRSNVMVATPDARAVTPKTRESASNAKLDS